MKNAAESSRFAPLPAIEGDLGELEAEFPDADILRLLEHDSMRVYYDVGVHGSRFSLSELSTTTARAELILPTLQRLVGELGEGATALDLACSPGYFMFKLAQLGMTSVVGVDVREDHRLQFHLLNRSYGFDNVTFEHMDISTFLDATASEGRTYDLCMLFGFLYHTSTPIELLRSIREVCSRYLVIDTTLSRRTDPSLVAFREDTEWSRASSAELSLMPSFSVVPLLLEAAGFETVERVIPNATLRHSNPGGDDIDYYFDTAPASRKVQDAIGSRARAIGRRLPGLSGRLADARRRPSPRAFFLATVSK